MMSYADLGYNESSGESRDCSVSLLKDIFLDNGDEEGNNVITSGRVSDSEFVDTVIPLEHGELELSDRDGYDEITLSTEGAITGMRRNEVVRKFSAKIHLDTLGGRFHISYGEGINAPWEVFDGTLGDLAKILAKSKIN